MDRFRKIALNNTLSRYRIIVTGCGYSASKKAFFDKTTKRPTHDAISINKQECKLNIGAATAVVLALSGATVHMVSSSKEKLGHLKVFIESILREKTNENISPVEYSALNLFDEKEVEIFVKSLSEDKPLYWVHSLGLGAGSYKLIDDNPYLKIEDIPVELFRQEFSVIEATHLMVQKLLPRFRKQDETKIVMVTSMSAVRYYPYGSAHCAAKSALDAYAKVLDMELFKENIFVTKIRPGMVDTGMYDSQAVQNANIEIAKFFGIDNTISGIRLAPPSSVANIISTVLTSESHIPSVNLIAIGQETIEGS